VRLNGKSALITGAGHGIGRGIAKRFGHEGASVLVTDIDLEAAARVADEIRSAGGTGHACRLDVREPDQAAAAVDQAVSRFGKLDAAVNNAGRTSRMPFLEMTLEFFEELVRLDLTGIFICAQAEARQMARQGHGRIVNIASNSGIRGGRGRAAYGATKAGIINLGQSMAIELAEFGILVNTLAPGPTRTERTTSDVPGPAFTNQMPLKRFGEPDEMGAAAAFLCSDDCTFTTGHVLSVDGGLTATGIMEG
jgi:NAD(P)-dependent dehydrogenase (short-subunit alcohol dehydrogenase family)